MKNARGQALTEPLLSGILRRMTLISLDGVSKSLGEGPLFSDVSFGIEEGERIGFVGPNGCGKSTLLRILAKRLEVDDGTVSRKRDLRVNMLDQEPHWEPGDSIRDFLFRSDDPLVRLVDRYERALADSHSSPKALADLTHQMEDLGGFSLEHRFASFLSELGIADLNLPMDTLSGGMAKKAALARCLAPDSELILLDEPTNHLDVDTIEWLERKLIQSGTAFVLVTHDRWFLDEVSTVIIDIDGGRAFKYAGNYSEYLERVAERRAFAEVREQRRESILRVELEWLKRGPKARGGKDKKRKSRIRDLVDGRPEAEEAGSEVFMTAARRLGRKVLDLSGVRKSWGTREVLAPFSYKLSAGERIGIVGPNGSGKSTLLDLLAARTEPDAGTIARGDTVAVGYFDQTGTGMASELTLLQYVSAAAERIRLGDGTELTAEQFLERFGFPRSMHGQPVGKLSGGERRRLLLVRILIAAPNVLLLDEPTNDIDIPTIALLEDFLDSFAGCVVAVSHDRAFLERTADSLWVLDGSGAVESFVGSYADWRRDRARGGAAANSMAAASAAPTKPNAVASAQAASGSADRADAAKKLSFKEKQELEALLPQIEALEAEKAELEQRFADPAAALAKDATAYAASTVRYGELDTLIDEKTRRWEELAARS